MKKLFGIAVFLLLLTLTACGSRPELGDAWEGEVNTDPKIVLSVKEGAARPGMLTLEICSGYELGELKSGNAYDYFIQTEQDGVWYTLKPKQELANTADALLYPKDEIVEQELKWGDRYGSLPKGHYRVVKAFTFYEETPTNTPPVFTAAEFTLD